jgi:hypothetical protein
MFCKNARTLIALTSEASGRSPVPPSPAIVKESVALPKSLSLVPIQQCQQKQPVKSSDTETELTLRRHQLDSTVQFLLTQKFNLCKESEQRPGMKAAPLFPLQLGVEDLLRLQQQKLPRNQFLSHGDGCQQNIPSIMTLASETICSTNTPCCTTTNVQNPSGGSMNLWQQIQAQKQQEAQMMQLRQLMALHLQRQQIRNQSSAKKFRASAA